MRAGPGMTELSRLRLDLRATPMDRRHRRLGSRMTEGRARARQAFRKAEGSSTPNIADASRPVAQLPAAWTCARSSSPEREQTLPITQFRLSPAVPCR
jgi:hypothetical protein